MERTEQAASRLDDAASAAKDAVQDGAAAASQKATEVKAEMKATAAKVKDQVVAAGGQAAQTVADPEKRKAAQSSAEQWIRENPWAATAIAAVVGMRVGRGFHRR